MYALNKMVVTRRILSQDQMHNSLGLLLIMSSLYTPSNSWMSFENPCSTPILENGRIELLQNGMVAKFRCHPNYHPLGAETATCIHGEWDENPPRCILLNCEVFQPFKNGMIIARRSNFVATVLCHHGYYFATKGDHLEAPENWGDWETRRGYVFCDGIRWNTSDYLCVPVPSTKAPSTTPPSQTTEEATATTTPFPETTEEPNYITSTPSPDSTSDYSDNPTLTESPSLLPSTSDYSEVPTLPPPTPPFPLPSSYKPPPSPTTTSPAPPKSPTTSHSAPPSLSPPTRNAPSIPLALTSPAPTLSVPSSSTPAKGKPLLGPPAITLGNFTERTHPGTLPPVIKAPDSTKKTKITPEPRRSDTEGPTTHPPSENVSSNSTPTSAPKGEPPATPLSAAPPSPPPGGSSNRTMAFEEGAASPGWDKGEVKSVAFSPPVVWTAAVASVVILVALLSAFVWRFSRRRLEAARESGGNDSEFLCLTSELEQSGL